MDSILDTYFRDVDKTIVRMKNYPSKELVLLHHNDTDGLTSGAVLYKAFCDEGYKVQRFSLEKPYPKVLEKLFAENSGKIIVFADFAGKIAPFVCKLNADKNLVILLDHHKAEKSTSDSVINLDPDLYGLKGDRDISASVTCWYFACRLNPANKKLAHIAALGGIADFFYIDWQVHGENWKCVEEALKQGTMRMEKKDGKDVFYITLPDREFEIIELYSMLDIIGGVGFYGGGPELGIKMLLHGTDDADQKTIEKFRSMKKEKFDKEFERIRKGEFNQTEHIVWCDVKDRFMPMGVKMIGIFCEEVADSGLVPKDKYMAGYQQIPDEVPGFGHVDMGETKVSMRTSLPLTDRVMHDEIPGLNAFLPEATLNLGGFADACHRVSAATTIKIGKEALLMDECENVLKKLMNK